MEKKIQKQGFTIGNVHCSSCEGKVIQLLTTLHGVEEVLVNVLRKKMYVSFDTEKVGVAAIQDSVAKAMQKAGYTATPLSSAENTKKDITSIPAFSADQTPFMMAPTAKPLQSPPPQSTTPLQEQAFLLHKAHCASCQGKIHTALMELEGIEAAEVNTLRRSVVVKYNAAVLCPAGIIEAFSQSKYKLQEVKKEDLPPLIPLIQDVKQKKIPSIEPQKSNPLQEQAFLLHKAHCASCQGKIHAALMALEGIEAAEVNTLRRSVVVKYNTAVLCPAGIIEAFAQSKYKLQEVKKEELPPLIPLIQDVKQNKTPAVISKVAQDIEPQKTVEEKKNLQEQSFKIGNVHCSSCEDRVQKLLLALGGVQSVQVNLLRKTMQVRFDSTSIDAKGIAAAMEGAGYTAAPMITMLSQSHEISASASSDTNFNSPLDVQENISNKDVEKETFPFALCLSLFFAALLMYVAMAPMFGIALPAFMQVHSHNLQATWYWSLCQALLCVPLLILHRRTFTSGFRALMQKSPNMDSLVGLGSAAAAVFGFYALIKIYMAWEQGHANTMAYYSRNLYFDSAGMILALIGLGKYFESKARDRAGSAIDALMRLSPPTALCLRDGKEISIATEDIRPGDTLVVYAGESLAADGIIIHGHAFIDTSVITGESLPQEKKVGDSVIGATVSQSGYFHMRVTKAGSDTALAHIIDLVESATASKAPIARLADKISAIFVPIIISIAFITLTVWLSLGYSLEFALSTAIAVLVISCPCALGLATPTAIMVGMGLGAEKGILFKSATALEQLQAIDTVVLDKTGTLTHGQPKVTDILAISEGHNPEQEKKLILFAASLERLSEHPLGKAIVHCATEKEVELLPKESFTDFQQWAGLGIMANYTQEDGIQNRLVAGNARLLSRENIDNPLVEKEKEWARQGKTVLYFALNDTLLGIIAVADTIKPSSKSAVQDLKNLGLNVLMLTGDNAQTAKVVQQQVDIDTMVAEVLPQEKADQVQKLTESGHTIAMVGDGINDAPALASAHVGIAIGAGTDIAIQSADIVLMQSDVAQVTAALRLSKAVMRTIKQNLFWAFAYNILLIPVAAGVFATFGLLLSPMLAAASMSMSSLTVVGNALRLRLQKKALF